MVYQILNSNGRRHSTHATHAEAEAALAVTPNVGCPVRGYKIVQEPAPAAPTSSRSYYSRNHNAARTISTAQADDEDVQYARTRQWRS
jgi:hypothetical protein